MMDDGLKYLNISFTY